jgi:hypothetical protein
VTIVAACINADTGVGPSIASGNQVCNPICADLPIEPINNSIHTVVIISKPKKILVLLLANTGAKGKTIANSILQKNL